MPARQPSPAPKRPSSEGVQHTLEHLHDHLIRIESAILKSVAGLATRKDLAFHMGTIMGKITEYLNQQKAFNAQVATATASIATSITEVSDDVDEILRKLQALDNTPGEFTPEDQAIVTELIAEGSEAAAKLTAAAEALAAINNKVPPVVPVVPVAQ